jgi:heme oxygenase
MEDEAVPSGTATAARSTPAGVLRDRTRGAHERVEARVDAPARLADRSAYRSWLDLLLGFHAATDAVLEIAFAETGLPPSGRVQRLRRDLAALGASAAEIAAVPQLDPAWIAGGASACGTLYVVEGSALGGAVLGRQARAELDVTPLSGAAFFSGAGSPAPRWRAVCAVLDDRLGDDDDARVVAVGGALAAFAAFEEWACR